MAKFKEKNDVTIFTESDYLPSTALKAILKGMSDENFQFYSNKTVRVSSQRIGVLVFVNKDTLYKSAMASPGFKSHFPDEVDISKHAAYAANVIHTAIDMVSDPASNKAFSTKSGGKLARWTSSAKTAVFVSGTQRSSDTFFTGNQTFSVRPTLVSLLQKDLASGAATPDLAATPELAAATMHMIAKTSTVAKDFPGIHTKEAAKLYANGLLNRGHILSNKGGGLHLAAVNFMNHLFPGNSPSAAEIIGTFQQKIQQSIDLDYKAGAGKQTFTADAVIGSNKAKLITVMEQGQLSELNMAGGGAQAAISTQERRNIEAQLQSQGLSDAEIEKQQIKVERDTFKNIASKLHPLIQKGIGIAHDDANIHFLAGISSSVQSALAKVGSSGTVRGEIKPLVDALAQLDTKTRKATEKHFKLLNKYLKSSEFRARAYKEAVVYEQKVKGTTVSFKNTEKAEIYPAGDVELDASATLEGILLEALRNAFNGNGQSSDKNLGLSAQEIMVGSKAMRPQALPSVAPRKSILTWRTGKFGNSIRVHDVIVGRDLTTPMFIKYSHEAKYRVYDAVSKDKLAGWRSARNTIRGAITWYISALTAREVARGIFTKEFKAKVDKLKIRLRYVGEK